MDVASLADLLHEAALAWRDFMVLDYSGGSKHARR